MSVYSSSSNDVESICRRFNNDKQKENFQRFLEHDTKVLDLSWCRFHDAGTKILAERIKTRAILKELILQSCGLKEKDIKCLLVAFEINTSIEVVNLNWNEVGDELATRIGMSIKNNNRLNVISLHNCRIGNVGMTGLSDGLLINNSVERIRVSGNFRIGYKGIKAFSLMLKVNTGLKEINFRFCCLTDKEIEPVISSLEHNSAVETIDFGCNSFGMKSAEAFKRMIQINCSLKNIILSSCSLRSNAVKSIVDGLTESTNSILEHIDFSDNSMDYESATEIGMLLRSSSSLKIICLEGCSLSSAQIKIILEGMIENFDSSIEHINLNHNDIDDDCATSIGMLLKRINCTIKVLELQQTMKPSGIKIIAEGLDHNASVEEIDLSRNWREDGESGSDESDDDEIDDSGGGDDDNNNENDDATMSIVNMLKVNNTLKVLKLDGTNYVIDPKLGRHMIKCLVNHTCMERIIFEDKTLSLDDDTAVAAFADLLKTNQRLCEFRITVGENISINAKKELIEGFRQNYTMETICPSNYENDDMQEIGFYLERNRRGIGRCFVGEGRCVRNVISTSLPTTSLWPYIFSKLGDNILLKRRSNCSSDNIIAEVSLLYHLVCEKPYLINNVTCVGDSRSCSCNTDEKEYGDGQKEQKRQRLD